MKPFTVTFPASRLARSAIAAAAALPLIFGAVAPAPALAFTDSSPTGIDVSKWQRPNGVSLDWEKVAASGEKFAFIKATDGKEGDSPYFTEDSRAAADAGLIIGSYHKAHPDRDPIKQADDYAALLNSQPSDARILPPVLDLELDGGKSASEIEEWAGKFLERLEMKTGVTPMIYTYRWFWETAMNGSEKFTEYPLWLAAYQPTPPTDVPGGWDEPLFWQNSNVGVVPGIPTPVDLNKFNGTESELEALTRGNGRATAAGATTAGTDADREVQADGADRSRSRRDAPATIGGDNGNGKRNEQRDAAAAEGTTPGAGSIDLEPSGSGHYIVDSDGNVRPAEGNGTGTGRGDREGNGNGNGTRDENGTGNGTGTGNGAGTEDGDDAESPAVTPSLVEAVIDAVMDGSSDASLETVRDAAEEAGISEDMVDLILAYLGRADREDVPLDLLEKMGDDAGNRNGPTTSDLIALLAGAGR